MLERFEAKISRCPISGCWLWTAGINAHGYGDFWAHGRTNAAHRIAWELWVGQVPNGLHVLHRCDVRCCVNPAHLFLGTNADNMADRNAKQRQAFGKRNGAHTKPDRVRHGEAQGAAKLTEAQAIAIRNDPRRPRFISAQYGVSRQTIHRIKRGTAWSHIA